MKRLFRLLNPLAGSFTALMGVVALTGCTDSTTGDGFGAPDGLGVTEVVWLSDGRIYYVVAGVSEEPDELWRKAAGSDDAEQVVPSVGSQCGEPLKYWSLFRTGENLGISALCSVSGDESILTMHTSTLHATTAMTIPRSSDSMAYSVLGYYMDNNAGACRGLAVATDEGWALLDVSINGDVATLRNDANADLCDSQLAAGYPAASADGRRLAFVVFEEEGQATLYYGMAGEPAKAVRGDIGDPVDVAVSPDGQRIAVSTFGLGPGRRILLIDPEKQAISQLAEGEFGEIAFSSDGRLLVAVEYSSTNNSDFRIIDLT